MHGRSLNQIPSFF
jgi:hypothetical protein